jgi:hypothetical protein
MCHIGVMDLRSYVDTLRHELAVAAEAGGEDARELAERLVAPLESSIQLVLLEALSSAAAEITRELAPGSVELRLRGREPSFVVTLPPADIPFEPETPARDVTPPVVPDGEDDTMARINFRMPEHLKARIEQAASQAGLSINSWLVRAAAAALEPDDRGRREHHAPWGGQRYTGWVR